ncbi:hypothetical protein PA25_05330 [Pseudoalteromonas sp. A25]|uniref:hypothetical protein n=1 Tax=Pseudoalteromonas sp. A25 TaxID=116092 RepID=UPI0012611941|nr:hypothetical protein [Pseudoalteromonas sp. A25]BBN80548.1 hypothetical protein PA25_05330 [Pseudoalteromonas sp. A25]
MKNKLRLASFTALLLFVPQSYAKTVSYTGTNCVDKYAKQGESRLKYRHHSASGIENTTDSSVTVFCPVNLEQDNLIDKVVVYASTHKANSSIFSCSLSVTGMYNPGVTIASLSASNSDKARFGLELLANDAYEQRLQSYRQTYADNSEASAYLTCSIPGVAQAHLNTKYGYTRLIGYTVKYKDY